MGKWNDDGKRLKMMMFEKYKNFSKIQRVMQLNHQITLDLLNIAVKLVKFTFRKNTLSFTILRDSQSISFQRIAVYS